MTDLPTQKETPDPLRRSSPPGKIKLAEALQTLLEAKDFSSITTSEIAKVAGVNEALIYRYFKDKRGLLHDVLSHAIEDFMSEIAGELRRIKGAAKKLRRLLRRSIDFYIGHRVSAKILLLEVRHFPGYFESPTYLLAKSYAHLVLEILREGIAAGEFRDDVSPVEIMQIILGGMEHLILPAIVFDRRVDADSSAEALCDIIWNGILTVRSQRRG
jgi:TetR/AcrR family transcriptional regulator, fatty acid metabolism regulator protein